ncbi:hypothetical protein [Streptomyces sp. CBMA123]|uniref:hypothetical protein n=1 Tax=Streptomyces sp. CBMA123 TaxID=1896313 RepID=UPI0016619A7C|nr:hypothetical protein [Streptomyces sp. CBMA123]MBD0694798.1 hypothetical protein [Streptomyces sp. CBMA123]
MRTRLRPRTGEGMALLGVLLLIVLELVALTTAPAGDRAVIGGTLIGAGTAAFVIVAALLHSRHNRERHARQSLPPVTDSNWFDGQALEGFPMEAVRPMLLGPHAPSLNRLYAAWVLATHGHDAVWIIHHLDLPADVTHLLVDAAHRQSAGADRTRAG